MTKQIRAVGRSGSRPCSAIPHLSSSQPEFCYRAWQCSIRDAFAVFARQKVSDRSYIDYGQAVRLSDQFGLLARRDVDGEVNFEKGEDGNPVNDHEIEKWFGNVSAVLTGVLVDEVTTVPGFSSEIRYAVAMHAGLSESRRQTGFEVVKRIHFILSQQNAALLAERLCSPGGGKRH
ncbi:MAG: hypothetical protein H6822_35305 [Planctomycetaceae bacterium]|nr:hypothetical protein [Planctomycetaceae bacterium]